MTIASLRGVSDRLLESDVLFVDRASPGAVELATLFHEAGKIVVFEPSSSRVDHLFQKLLRMANIVKYSHDRFPQIEEDTWPSGRKLEIQTLGRGGLRFRMARRSDLSMWQHLHAPKRETLIDPCGAGDWATAGLIELTCKAGVANLENLSKEGVIRALSFCAKAWELELRFCRSARGDVQHV